MPLEVWPARCILTALTSFRLVLIRSGSSRSSKKMSRNSSRDSEKTKSSWPSPLSRRFLVAALAGAALRLGDLVARHELLVARQDALAVAAVRGVAEARLADALGRDRDLAAIAGVGDPAAVDRLVDRVLDLRAGAPEEALAVAKALVLGIQPPVDQEWHRLPRAWYLPHPALLTRMYHSTSRRTWRSV